MDELADTHMLSGAYALDAVDDDEREAFERHLTECPDCRTEVDELRRTMVRLADASAVAPPEELRRLVLEQIRHTPQLATRPTGPETPDAEGPTSEGPTSEGPTSEGPTSEGPTPEGPTSGRPAGAAPTPPAPGRIPSQRGPSRAGPRRVLVPWLVAAVLAVLAGGTGVLAWQQHHDAQTSAAAARSASEAARAAARLNAVVGDPDARRVVGPATGGGRVTLVLADQGSAIITSRLPGLDQRRTYQLWIVRPSAISSAGLGPGGPEAAGSWSRLVAGVRTGDVVAISVEPTGGSPQPTTTPIITLKA